MAAVRSQRSFTIRLYSVRRVRAVRLSEQKSPMLAVTEVRISRWRGDWLPTGGRSRGRGGGAGWGAVAAGARALKEKAERSGASPCEFDYQVGRRGCLLLAIGPVHEAQNPATSTLIAGAACVSRAQFYAVRDRRFTIYDLRWSCKLAPRFPVTGNHRVVGSCAVVVL